MSRHLIVPALAGLLLLTGACSRDTAPAARPPALSLAAEIPEFAGCYGPVDLGTGTDNPPRRIPGDTLNFSFDGGGRYTVARAGKTAGSAQFVPVGGVALYAAGNPQRVQGAVGAQIGLRSAEHMRSFISTAYPQAIADPGYSSIQLTLLALQSDLIADRNGDAESGYGYYAYVYAWPGVLGAGRLDPFDPALKETADKYGVQIGGSPRAPEITADDENQLFLFFRDWLNEVDLGGGPELTSFARLSSGC